MYRLAYHTDQSPTNTLSIVDIGHDYNIYFVDCRPHSMLYQSG